MSDARHQLTKAKRIVVKLGSSALSSDPELPARLSEQVAELMHGGRRFVLVSSGAIALGVTRLGFRGRPREMARLQAAAAAGQSVLMHRYETALGRAGLTAAQVLLTHADLADRERLNNARQALGALLEARAVPIVNENDTVATEEIRFGDNDQLAAMVAPLVGAELLVLLTDVEGVLDGAGRRISVLEDGSEVGALVKTQNSGSGGISSKLDAARKASRSGAAVVVARASRERVLCDILAAEDVGTLIPRRGSPMRARKHWIMFTLRPSGALLIDDGAARAVRSGKSSLLPVGILGVRGQFNPGDSVRLVAPDGSEVGRGLTRLGALDVARAAGKKGAELDLLFGPRAQGLVVVHKDDLVTGD
ncbi:MAG TPA: glutamate 5-kinase [Polyangiaceae bacterium]|jgi:glutamate 5-kinase